MLIIQELSRILSHRNNRNGDLGSLLSCQFILLLRKRMPLSRQIAYFLLGVCVLVISTATFLDWVIACAC